MSDHRQTAQARIGDLIVLLKTQPDNLTQALIDECEALAHAIGAFHMEGIRFRMYNVDRLIARAGAAVPVGASAILEEARANLEAAGFHTRSHQAPS